MPYIIARSNEAGLFALEARNAREAVAKAKRFKREGNFVVVTDMATAKTVPLDALERALRPH